MSRIDELRSTTYVLEAAMGHIKEFGFNLHTYGEQGVPCCYIGSVRRGAEITGADVNPALYAVDAVAREVIGDKHDEVDKVLNSLGYHTLEERALLPGLGRLMETLGFAEMAGMDNPTRTKRALELLQRAIDRTTDEIVALLAEHEDPVIESERELVSA